MSPIPTSHAIVIGASMGGLAAAAAVARHADLVTIVERDELPSGPAFRRGVPQARHLHVLQPGSSSALERLVPGLEWILDLFLSVGTPVQAAVPELLAARHPYQWALRGRIQENLGALDRAAARSEGAFERYRGEGGTSAIVRLDPPGMERGQELATWALEERDVYAHPAHFYDLDRDDLLVVSLITPPAVLDEALERLLEP
jgi:pimeloyl-ACP methyl ester carboxylesterase